MSKNKNKSAEELRRRAEKRLIKSQQKGASPATPEELQRLVHELEVRFSISDTGIGISPDKMDWFFESFTQIDPSGTHQFEGTGLGLAISKSLVELMGGSIGVTSVENRGSTFYFTIPFALPGETGKTTEAFFAEELGESLSEQPLPGQRKTLEILVVEDKPMNRRLATALLEKKGHKVFRPGWQGRIDLRKGRS